MPHTHHTHYRNMYPFFQIYAALLFITGVLMDPPDQVLAGLRDILLSEDNLITDYIQVGGLGAALVNAALVTLASIWIMKLSGEPLNGYAMVLIGLMSGFSLFGKNILNIWPIILGTWLYSVICRERFGKYVTVALLSTALAPMVSYVGLENEWGSPALGLILGMGIGFIMPPLSAYTYKIQNGMNLYNVGFACGLVATMLVPLMIYLGASPATNYHWATGYNLQLGCMLTVLCVVLIVSGFFFCKRPYWAAWAGYRRLLHTTGRAPSDYLRLFGFAPVLINTGINGLIGMLCILAVGGDLNGPTVGGILTIMGFSAFGKHAWNIIPVMLGVVFGGFMMDWSLRDGAVQLACLFCTTLAPISGYFGWPFGMLAGFLHASVVLSAGSPVSGLNLYNNGFSGGILAIILYPTILDIVRRRQPELQNEDYFEIIHEDSNQTPVENEVVEHVIHQEEEKR